MTYDSISNKFKTENYIDGSWVSGGAKTFIEVVNPSTEKVIAKVANGTVADAKRATKAAAKAFETWSKTTPRYRSDILYRAYELILRDAEQLAQLITFENGKAMPDSMGEVKYAAEFFRWYSEECVRNLGSISHAPASGARIIAQHKAAGVAILVTPWNFPAAMGTRKIGPALAAGCTCVVKPAGETPLTMLAIAELLHEAGVPKGVVNVVCSTQSSDVVSEMLSHPKVRVLSFTGSTEVGKILLREAAKYVVNPCMELGGNAPFLVFDDADLDAAVEGAMIAKMRNMGEACTAANRFYVQDNIHDAFVAKFAEKMSDLKVGFGLDPDVSVGPLVNAKTRDKVEHFVEDAVSKGARIVCGGDRGRETGYFFNPTVLADVPPNADCVCDEIFGPVAPVFRFKDTSEVIAAANSSEYGLAAYVFTEDLKRGLQVSEALEFGMIGLNRGVLSDAAAPFGGVKQSGLGREGAHEGLMEYLETQYISAEW